MDDKGLLDGLEAIEDEDYGGIYIEYGGFESHRTIYRDSQGWWLSMNGHRTDFKCDSLRDAIECFLSPPSEQEWEENIKDQHRGGPEEVDDQPPRKDEI